MALNIIQEDADALDLPVTSPSTPASGDPVLCGQIPGVAQGAKRADTGLTSVKLVGTATLSVKGENNAGNSAVAVGDILYYEAGQTPPVNKDNVAGVRFGYALGTVGSGATATILVKIGY